MMQCVAEGHEISALANLRPKDKDELDSYMFQTVGHHAVDMYAEAMDVPLYRRTLEGTSVAQGRDYHVTSDDEVEDLYELLKQVKSEQSVEGVSVGAILSDYQRVRVEHVCQRLGLTSLAYLWRRDQSELLEEMIKCQVEAIVIKVAALGLDPDKHLGKTIAEIYPHMLNMKAKYGLNVCGEGGEYETFTLDCPLFKKKLLLDEMEQVVHSNDAFAPVGYLNLKKIHLENKPQHPSSMMEYIQCLPMLHSSQLHKQLFEEDLSPDLSTSLQDKDTTDVHCKNSQYLCERAPLVHQGCSRYTSVTGIVAYRDSSQSVEQSTRIAMEQLKNLLTENDLTPSGLLCVHLYVSDMYNFSQVNTVYKQYFDINPPVRVCVQANLPENVLLQLDCVGMSNHQKAPSTHQVSPHDVSTMHVQGLSHWAPANIGPYSQAKKCGQLVFVAGQIALCPATMVIITGGVRSEARLSLRHVTRVLAAMATGCDIKDVVMAVCYLTDHKYIETAQEELQAALQKDQDRADGPQSPPLSVEWVIVPSLPRGALIEWQVYAACDWQETWTGLKCTLTNAIYQGQISAHYSSTEEQSLSTFLIHIDTQDEFQTNHDESAAVTLAVECLHKVLDHAGKTGDTLRVLRVFYRTDMDINRLQQAYLSQAQVTLSKNNFPAASFVPVSGFQSRTTVLGVCH